MNKKTITILVLAIALIGLGLWIEQLDYNNGRVGTEVQVLPTETSSGEITRIEENSEVTEVLPTVKPEIVKLDPSITEKSVLSQIRENSKIIGELQKGELTEEEHARISPTNEHANYTVSSNGKYVVSIKQKDGESWKPESIVIKNIKTGVNYIVDTKSFVFGEQIVATAFSKDENYILLFNQSEAEGIQGTAKFKIIVKN